MLLLLRRLLLECSTRLGPRFRRCLLHTRCVLLAYLTGVAPHLLSCLLCVCFYFLISFYCSLFEFGRRLLLRSCTGLDVFSAALLRAFHCLLCLLLRLFLRLLHILRSRRRRRCRCRCTLHAITPIRASVR